MRIEITKDEYEILQEFFELHSIKVNVRSVVMDEMLVKLGFAEKIPCVVEMDISKDELDRIWEICDNYDVAACNSEDSYVTRWDPVSRRLVTEPSEAEKLYERYGWVYWCLAYYRE